MKTLFAGLLVFFIILQTKASVEQETTEAFTKEYLKEQIKHQVEIYLNQHPNVVGSINPKIGSLSINMVSRILAINNLIHANSDKERAWAVSQIIISPEPTTALILFAVQLSDTMISLRHESNLARIREETAEINKQTVDILTAVAIDEIGLQLGIINRFDGTVAEIEKTRKSLTETKVFNYLSSNSQGRAPDFTETEVSEAIRLLELLNQSLISLESISVLMESCVKPNDLGVSSNTVSEDLRLVDAYRPLVDNVARLEETFNMIFSTMNSERQIEQVNQALLPYADELKIYNKCVQYQNRLMTDEFWHHANKMRNQGDFLSLCQKRFSKKSGE